MSEQIVPQDFYVYVHRTFSGRVFYVGKGQGKRGWSDQSRNKHWHNIVNKHGLVVEVVESGLQEWYAFELECGLITLYGRETLCNMTNGGEGTSGRVPSEKHRLALSKPLSEKHRLALSAALKGKPKSEKTRLAMSKPKSEKHRLALSKPKSEKHRLALSAALKGKPKSEKTRLAIRAARTKPILCIETGQIFQTSYCAEKWLRSNGKQKALGGAVYACCNNKAKSAYGYTWRYA
jgi:hypothetical protein